MIFSDKKGLILILMRYVKGRLTLLEKIISISYPLIHVDKAV